MSELTDRPTPETDAMIEENGLACKCAEKPKELCRRLEQQRDAAVEALERIAKCEDAPDIDPAGDWEFGLHCGVEDRGCASRYDGANYGHAVGVERALEWASNEAKAALAAIKDTK